MTEICCFDSLLSLKEKGNNMRISEIVGLIILECSCKKQKFTVNTTSIDSGFTVTCPSCKKTCKVNRWSQLEITLKQGTCSEFYDSAVKREFNKPVGEAMELGQYKMLLAETILNGKAPRINRKHKDVVNIGVDDSQIINAYESYRNLGMSKAEALSKLTVDLSACLRHSEDILQYILTKI